MDLVAIAKIERRQRARVSQQRGALGEAIVMSRLRAAGYGLVRCIKTGHRKIGGRWVPCERVEGDVRAVAPGGLSVLVECKMRDERLVWSDLEPHQRDALDEHHRLGGLSFVAWIHLPDVDVMRWPVADFGPGESITAADVLDRQLRWQP